ncbi:MAG: M4 family metallopeptidase [Opitutaceae bacterium]
MKSSRPLAHAASWLRLGLISAILALSVPLGAQSAEQHREKWEVATDVASVLKNLSNAKVGSVSRKGTPTSLVGKLGQLQKTKQEISEQDLAPVLDGILPALRLKQGDLRLAGIQIDELGSTHARYIQYKNGLEVVGTRLSLHVDKKGLVYSAFGNARDGEDLPKTAAIDAAKATKQVLEVNSAAKDLKADGARLVYIVTSDKQDMHLAWEIHVVGTGEKLPIDELVFVDAVSGKVVDRHTRIFPAMYREVYKLATGSPPDYPEFPPNWPEINYRVENSSVDSLWDRTEPDLTSIAFPNWNNLDNSYRYYYNGNQRDSYDGSGGHLVSYLNSSVDPNNAYWNGTYHMMNFGVGDGTNFGPLAADSDVVTHELSHGVTQYSSSLVYAFESGALNEAFSDIMAAAEYSYNNGNSTAADVWKIGEGCYTPSTSGDALRYMNDPAADGSSRDYYPDRLIADYAYDAGGVHYNSGIANLAFYLSVVGGTHPRSKSQVNVPGFTDQNDAPVRKAYRIFYRAFTVYLGPGSQMIDARMATVQAASDLYSSTEVTNVNLAWDAVGVPSIVDNNCSINLSTRANAGTGNDIMIAGIKLAGGSTAKPIILRGMGPTLASLGVSGVMADPILTLYSGQTQLAQNDNWSSSPDKTAIQQATSAVGLYSFPDPSLDSAILYTLSAGSYTAQVCGNQGGTGQVLIEAYDTDSSNPNHLSGIASRCRVTSDPMIAGFGITGTSHKRLLIRAVGPGLSGQVPGYITDPKLTIYSGATPIYQNDDWNYLDSGIAAATTRVGLSALQSGSNDAVLLVSLPPGAYTAVVEGVSGATGICLLEVYEVTGQL